MANIKDAHIKRKKEKNNNNKDHTFYACTPPTYTRTHSSCGCDDYVRRRQTHTEEEKKWVSTECFFFVFVVVLTEECVELFLLFTSDVRTNTNMCYIFSIYEVVILIVIRCFAVARVNQRWGVHLTHSCAITISCSRQIHRSPSK